MSRGCGDGGKTQIRINFTKAKQEAKKLDDIAEKLKKYADNDWESSIRGLSSAWIGDNSRSFLKKEESLKANMLKTARDLQGVAADIRRIAKHIPNFQRELSENDGSLCAFLWRQRRPVTYRLAISINEIPKIRGENAGIIDTLNRRGHQNISSLMDN